MPSEARLIRPHLTRKSALLLCAGSRYGVTGRMLEWLFAVLWPNEHGKVRSMRAYGYHIEPFPLRSILWPN